MKSKLIETLKQHENALIHHEESIKHLYETLQLVIQKVNGILHVMSEART